MFALPANMFGTGLAIKIQEQQKRVVHRTPAARIIRIVWKVYAHKHSNSVVWNKYRGEVTQTDKTSIRFLLILRYFVVKRHFTHIQSPDDIEINMSHVANATEKLQKLEKRLDDINNTLQRIMNKEFKEINELIQKIESKIESRNM